MGVDVGDIAFVMVNTDGDDNFAFITTTDIGPNEEISFTDQAWNGAGFQDFGAFGPSEFVVTWNSGGATIPAGTVIEINGTTATGGGSVTSGTAINLSGGGDSVTAFTGAVGAPTPIAQVTTDDDGFLNPGDVDGVTETALATGLVEGETALVLNDGGA